MVVIVKNLEDIMAEALSDLPLEESVARLRPVFEDGYGSYLPSDSKYGSVPLVKENTYGR